MEFFEASCFDFDAVLGKTTGNKPVIRKKYNSDSKGVSGRHSTAEEFFERNMMKDLLSKCEMFYKKFVNYEALNKSAPEEMTMVIEYINNE